MNNLLNVLSNLFYETDDSSSMKNDISSLTTEIYQKNQEKTNYKYTHKDTIDRIEKILSSNRTINAGQIKLIGLSSIKRKLGDKWPSMIETVHEHLISITKKHITEQDVFFSKSDDEFIIVFAQISENAAKLIAAKILQELTEKFTGSADTKEIIVKTAVQEVNGELLFKAEDLDFMLGQVNQQIEENKGEHGGDEGRKDIEETFTDVYCPVWDVKNEIVSTYMVTAGSNLIRDDNGILRFKKIGYDVLVDSQSERSRIALDKVLLSTGISDVEELVRNNFKAIYNIPVSYETVFKPELLMAYIRRCKTIPRLYNKFFTFSLLNFPDGIPESKLKVIVSSINNYCRATVLNVSRTDIDPAKYARAGVKIIGIDLKQLKLREKNKWEALTRFTEKCHKNKLQLSLENVDTLEKVMLAKEVGVDFISGEAIGIYRDTVEPMVRLPFKDLINRKT